MSVNGVEATADAVPQPLKVKTSKTHSTRSSPRSQSTPASPAGSDYSPKLEWHVCPNCKSVREVQSNGDEKSSTSTSPTNSDLSQSRSTSFTRIGTKIKKDFYGVFGQPQETPSSSPDKAKVSKPKKKKKPQKKVYLHDKGYEELGGDHWVNEW